MGTRNLTIVILDGVHRVAQYGQCDGYPDGQGETVLKFLLKEMDLEVFSAALRQVRFVDDPDAGRQFNRDTAADILSLVQSGEALELYDSLAFAADSLFCEWAYVIDLDAMVLEVFKGRNHKPLQSDERFAAMAKEQDSEYYPVRMIRRWAIHDLTAATMRDLTAELKRETEAEES